MPCLKDWEKYNVDIKHGRLKFRQHFVDIIEEEKRGVLQKKEVVNLNKVDDHLFIESQEVEMKRMNRGVTESDWKAEKDLRSKEERIFLESLW